VAARLLFPSLEAPTVKTAIYMAFLGVLFVVTFLFAFAVQVQP